MSYETTLTGAIGSAWTRAFSDKNVIQKLAHWYATGLRQIDEDVDILDSSFSLHSARASRTIQYAPIILSRATRNTSREVYWRVGDYLGQQPAGPLTDLAFQVGPGAVPPGWVSYPMGLPYSVLGVSQLVASPGGQPLLANHEFRISGDTLLTQSHQDPFTLPGVTILRTDSDTLCLLWASGVSHEIDVVSRTFGEMVGITREDAPVNDYYALIKSLYRLIYAGPTASSLTGVVATATGGPAPRIYRVVTTLDEGFAADVGFLPAPASLTGVGATLSFPIGSVDVTYNGLVAGNPHYTFALDGPDEAKEQFFRRLAITGESRSIAAATPGTPAGSVVGTISPANWLLSQIDGQTTLIVFDVPSAGYGRDAAKLLSSCLNWLPAGGLTLFIAKLQVSDDSYVSGDAVYDAVSPARAKVTNDIYLPAADQLTVKWVPKK